MVKEQHCIYIQYTQSGDGDAVGLHAEAVDVPVDVLKQRGEERAAGQGQLQGQLCTHVGQQLRLGDVRAHQRLEGRGVELRRAFLLHDHAVAHAEQPLEWAEMEYGIWNMVSGGYVVQYSTMQYSTVPHNTV
jgi:hypothetical protein